MGLLRFIEKYSIIIFTLLIVAFAMFLFGDFAGSFRSYVILLSEGQWMNPLWWLFGGGQDALLLTIFVLLIGYLLRKLLIWEVRAQSKF